MPPKRNVACIKPPDPPFIKRMKDSIGYQEPATVETKKQIADYDESDDIERDDEKPVVVVLKPGDLTEEEVKSITEKGLIDNFLIDVCCVEEVLRNADFDCNNQIWSVLDRIQNLHIFTPFASINNPPLKNQWKKAEMLFVDELWLSSDHEFFKYHNIEESTETEALSS